MRAIRSFRWDLVLGLVAVLAAAAVPVSSGEVAQLTGGITAPQVVTAAPSEAAGPLAPYCTQLERSGGFESGDFMAWHTSDGPSVWT